MDKQKPIEDLDGLITMPASSMEDGVRPRGVGATRRPPRKLGARILPLMSRRANSILGWAMGMKRVGVGKQCAMEFAFA